MIQKLMDAEQEVEPPMPPLSRGPNPYLGGDRCLFCRCERPPGSKLAEQVERQGDCFHGVVMVTGYYRGADCLEKKSSLKTEWILEMD